MNKKGFTLIELLAVMAIIALIGGIASIAYSSLVKSSADRVFETYMDSIHESCIMYFVDNPSQMPTASNTSRTISISSLPLEKIKNPLNSADYCSSSYILVTYLPVATAKGTSGIKYEVHLKCTTSGYERTKTYTN